jgi:hypothetical protein
VNYDQEPSMFKMNTKKDLTQESFQMPRDSALLYPNKKPRDEDSPHYFGVMVTKDGTSYWVGAWTATVKGQDVIKIKLIPK